MFKKLPERADYLHGKKSQDVIKPIIKAALATKGTRNHICKWKRNSELRIVYTAPRSMNIFSG